MSLSFSGFIDVLGLCQESENSRDATGSLPQSGWKSSLGRMDSRFLAEGHFSRALFVSDCVVLKPHICKCRSI